MSEAAESSRPLANRGFLSLVFTQFFGVVNDNLLKQVLSFGLTPTVPRNIFGHFRG